MHPAPMYLSVTLDDRRDSQGTVSLGTNDLDRLSIRAIQLVDDSNLRLVGSAFFSLFVLRLKTVEVASPWRKECSLQCPLARVDESIFQCFVLAGRAPLTLVETGGSNCSPHAGASTSQTAFVQGFNMAESILMHSRTLLSGSPDSYWDLSTTGHQMRALCMFSVAT